MKLHLRLHQIAALLASAAFCLGISAQEKDASPKDAKPPAGQDPMAMMMELAKPGDNHKLLAQGVGTWDYSVKFWMSPDPAAPPSESTGVSVTKEALGGRFFITEVSGKMQIPGPDGKLADFDFKGISTDGYDNIKKKFVSSWIDNMGTMIMFLEGTYDPARKAITYLAELEMIPGVKGKVKEVITLNDDNHRTMEYFEERDGNFVRTMEIKYTRRP